MSKEEVEKIKSFFASIKITPTYLEHDAVITSEEVAKVRGFELKQGIKAILFTNSYDDWVVINVPANKKVDQKKVAECLGWSKKKTRLATPDEVKQKTGCEIGAVPPLCHKEKIKILVDKNIYENHESDFNIGLRTSSLKIKTSLLKSVFEKVNAIEGEFSK